jgi:predicted DNA-binding transcriptional regulator YafY
MRRADRLFALIQALRGGRLRTARFLSEILEVSERTIYRDVADLIANGAPIDGARGVGYLLRDDYFLPPLRLSQAEKDALAWGVSFVVAHGDETLAHAARELKVKLEAIDRFHGNSSRQPLVFAGQHTARLKSDLKLLREAIIHRQKVLMRYHSIADHVSERVIWPLSLEHWGKVWTLTTWCETRCGFRTFRLDRIEALSCLNERFKAEPGKTMADFLATLSELGKT